MMPPFSHLAHHKKPSPSGSGLGEGHARKLSPGGALTPALSQRKREQKT